MLSDSIVEVVDIQYYIEVDGADYAIYEVDDTVDLILVMERGLPGKDATDSFTWVESQW